MDQDGANVRFLTQGDHLVVTPRYSPATQDITYMSQQTGQQPRVQVINLETGSRQVVGNFPDMTSSPRFSPDGQRIVMSLQQGGNANIFMMDLDSRTTTRLTSTSAIDTSPSFSPDGREIVFESDRGGQQQIYVMGADGSNPRRISFGDGSYSQPAWSPRGDYIAFTKRRAGGFAIGIMKPDGSGERILTEGFHNEGPTWAPERPVHHVLPRSRRPVGRQALHGRHHRPRRAAGADAVLRLRPDLVAAAQRRPLRIRPAPPPREAAPARPCAP